MKDTIEETRQQVPVVYDVDVVVAGGGIGGVFAGLAAARCGAETLIIDRFGSLGGNMGPGMISGGSFHGPPGAPIFGGFTGLAREFLERYVGLGGAVSPFQEPQYFRDSSIATYLSFKMLKEAGAHFMLSTYVADPILENKYVKGVFVENKSGRQAVKAAVTVDASGEADVARRAGAPIIYPKASNWDMDTHAPSGMGLFFALGNVNWQAYEAYEKIFELSDEDKRWSEKTLGRAYTETAVIPHHLIPHIRKAWESGEYRFIHKIDGLGYVVGGDLYPYSTPGTIEGKGAFYSAGIACRQVCVGRGKDFRFSEKVNAADGAHISKMESEVRIYIFETSRFWKKYVPGFENSYLLVTAPFLGTRGGPCIEGEYVFVKGKIEKHDDVIWESVPYRSLLPREIDGLIAVGRNISCIPDTALRHRDRAPMLGQVGGTAAALAAKRGVSPKEIDIRELQQTLLDAGFIFAEEDILKELGLTLLT